MYHHKGCDPEQDRSDPDPVRAKAKAKSFASPGGKGQQRFVILQPVIIGGLFLSQSCAL
jgi:hypothetical protein